MIFKDTIKFFAPIKSQDALRTNKKTWSEPVSIRGRWYQSSKGKQFNAGSAVGIRTATFFYNIKTIINQECEAEFDGLRWSLDSNPLTINSQRRWNVLHLTRKIGV